MPDETGTWKFQTKSQPEVNGLDGITGQFAVVEADTSNPLLKHGAVQVSENNRYLTYADGTPFFWLMDTAWNGALKSTEQNWETYLDDRLSKYFTGIQFVTTQWRAAHTDRQGQTAYSGYEDIKINPGFFQRLDERVNTINEKGLLAAPVVLWALGDKEEVPGKLPEDQAIKLGRYITARYGAHHVAWFLAGDENFSEESGERWRRIGDAVFREPQHEALATVHPQGRQWYLEEFRDKSWYDFIIYQSSHGGGPETIGWIHSGPPAQNYNNEPILPVINSEPGYEDHIAWERDERHTAFDIRQQAYYSLLSSPTAGVSYGAHGVWSWETKPSEPLNHKGSGIAKPWDGAMELPGSEDLKHLANLFKSAEWWTLRPDQKLLSSQPGGDDPTKYVATASATDGDFAIIYLPEGGKVTLETDQLASELKGEWMNPRDGSRQEAQFNGSGTYEAPNSEDWVLYLHKN
ncbi:glycoside hydrolase family 140 protein [Aliifodinibius salicampi]|uniref:Glycoside hydrolase family 140 protein n=1 Tax=Fodinibius salicampi TaxID=1920655 RepID=A0ABT3Q1D9_9BACT|nr:DUF4038 domain-containing protein [Fodinibius salicampi]MCW9713906.1 glycoside hydrolase family 140 protein [Fodinibius salicampi]